MNILQPIRSYISKNIWELLCSLAAISGLFILGYRTWWAPCYGLISEVPFFVFAIKNKHWALLPGTIGYTIMFIVLIFWWL
jgi:hypothetical protein